MVEMFRFIIELISVIVENLLMLVEEFLEDDYINENIISLYFALVTL